MFGNILSTFFGKAQYWDYYSLYTNLSKWQTNGTLPSASSFPQKIYMPSDFWTQIKDLHTLTLQDEHERAVSVWWVDGDICVTPTDRGERGSVTTSYNMQIKYTPREDLPQYIKKEFIVNGTTVFSKDLEYHQLPTKSEIFMLMHLHTHPPHYNETTNERYYNFFSATDIRSQFSGDGLLSGVIRDDIYLLCKTDDSPSHVPEDLSDFHISPEFLHEKLGLLQYKGNWQTGFFEKVQFE